MYLNNFFVFGTLLPGLNNYNYFIKKYNPNIYNARTKGIMYYLPEDGYPVVIDGERYIKGVLYNTEELPVILPEIDEIHKYTDIETQSHLIREIRDVEIIDTGETIKAHLYMWPPSKRQWLKKNGVIISDGDWTRFLKEQT
ncbi:MAG: gamma-glutamylcyclotransferase [Clostridiales bacterium]|nr:gamma-glutamylcyclotransferase [Clostridiales bacterium]MCF8021855.1 gamma-glutamylcyclotransferase [Clostridiales bacterium]